MTDIGPIPAGVRFRPTRGRKWATGAAEGAPPRTPPEGPRGSRHHLAGRSRRFFPRRGAGWSVLELLVAGLLLSLVIGVAFRVFRSFSAARVSLAARNSFQTICGPLFAQLNQDLRGARTITVSADRITVERYVGVAIGEALATEGVVYRFQPPRVIQERPEGTRTTDFSEVLATVGGTLVSRLSARMVASGPDHQEAVVTVVLAVEDPYHHPLPGLDFEAAITAKARERLDLSPGATSP